MLTNCTLATLTSHYCSMAMIAMPQQCEVKVATSLSKMSSQLIAMMIGFQLGISAGAELAEGKVTGRGLCAQDADEAAAGAGGMGH